LMPLLSDASRIGPPAPPRRRADGKKSQDHHGPGCRLGNGRCHGRDSSTAWRVRARRARTRRIRTWWTTAWRTAAARNELGTERSRERPATAAGKAAPTGTASSTAAARKTAAAGKTVNARVRCEGGIVQSRQGRQAAKIRIAVAHLGEHAFLRPGIHKGGLLARLGRKQRARATPAGRTFGKKGKRIFERGEDRGGLGRFAGGGIAASGHGDKKQAGQQRRQQKRALPSPAEFRRLHACRTAAENVLNSMQSICNAS